MSKVIRKEAKQYEEWITCGHCGFASKLSECALKDFDKTCQVCKKEGCAHCTTWFWNEDEKYIFHKSCRNGIPKRIIEEKNETDRAEDARQSAWDHEYNRGRDCS